VKAQCMELAWRSERNKECQYRISIASVWHQYSIRADFRLLQGDLYGKKTQKSPQDRTSSHVPVDPRQDGQDRLPPDSQWQRVGLPHTRYTCIICQANHTQVQVCPGCSGARPRRPTAGSGGSVWRMRSWPSGTRNSASSIWRWRRRARGVRDVPSIWRSRTIITAMTCSGSNSMAIERNQKAGPGSLLQRQGHDGETCKMHENGSHQLP
jgi:hypothetical protein